MKNVTLDRTRDGYYVGANFPINPTLAKEETTFDLKDSSLSGNTRRVRWVQLMEQNKGKIDAEAAKRFLADHLDVLTGTDTPSERTLCGHVDCSPRGMGTWQQPYGPAGAVQNKICDAALAGRMMFEGCLGHACGTNFVVKAHLAAHPEFDWQKAYLKDMPARPWTVLGGKGTAE